MVGLALAGLGLWAIFAFTGKARPVSITSSPSGARVSMDGTDLGQTPLSKVMVKGSATLHFEKADYLPADRKLGADETRVDIRLMPAPFSVRVETDPAGAGIWLDGTRVGSSPRTVQVSGPGRHQVEIRLDGYEPWTAILSRHEDLPSPIRLRKRGDPATPEPKDKVKKVKDFLKNLLDE